MIPAAASAAVAVASVTSAPSPEIAAQIGSWPGASPNQTRIRLLSGRQPIAGSVAICCSANSCPSEPSLPSSAVQVPMAPVAAAVFVVGETWCWKAYELGVGTGKSR